MERYMAEKKFVELEEKDQHHHLMVTGLAQAFHDGKIALLRCTDKLTGKPVMMVCAVSEPEEEGKDDVDFVPLAFLVDEDGEERYTPPPVPVPEGDMLFIEIEKERLH